MQNTNSYTDYDYKQCTFEIELKKKKTLGYYKRYAYFKQGEMVVNKEPYAPKPRKSMFIDPFWHVEWIYDKKKKDGPFHERCIGFTINSEQGQKMCEFYGDKLGFKQLRNYFSKQLFEIKFIDDFNIVRKIGKGRYAKVYEIEEKGTGKKFAAKYLDKQKISAIEYGKESLINELTILRKLDHNNCIKLVRTYEDEKGYFIVQELLNHTKSLYDEMARFKNPHFTHTTIRSIMKQLIEGIRYSHSLGIMHRDLKPQNIMFADKDHQTMNNIKIIDFGLAQFTAAKKYMYVHVGTPGYVAPEILANESENHTYSELCDIFSLGAIFHQLLTGKQVFSGRQFQDVLKLNKKADIHFIGKRYEEMNRDALNLLKYMLQQNPKLRITAQEALQHPYFQENLDQHNIRTYSQTQIDRSDSFTPQQPRKKNSLQFYGRYQPTTELSEEQQTKILQTLKSPETMKFDQTGHQKQMLYKVTKQLIDIVHNKQQKEYENIQYNFSSTSSPIRIFQMQKSRLNSNDSGNINSPKREAQQGQQESMEKMQPSIFSQTTPIRKSLEYSPSKKHSINHNISEIVKEEDEFNNKFRESAGEMPQLQQQQQQQKKKESEVQESDKFEFPPKQEITKTASQQYFSTDQKEKSTCITQQEEYKESPVNPQRISVRTQQITETLKDKYTSPQRGYREQSLSFSQQSPMSIQSQKEMIERQQYPKELNNLINYFPEQVITLFMKKDSENGKALRFLGLFFLFGNDRLIKNDNRTQINRALDQYQRNHIFDNWFIDLIKDMVYERIDLLNVQIVLRKYLNVNNGSSPVK